MFVHMASIGLCFPHFHNLEIRICRDIHRERVVDITQRNYDDSLIRYQHSEDKMSIQNVEYKINYGSICLIESNLYDTILVIQI